MAQDPIGPQMLAARALLGWSREQLCERAGVSRTVVVAVENGRGNPRRTTLDKLRSAVTSAGVVLLEPDASGGPGARLAWPSEAG